MVWNYVFTPNLWPSFLTVILLLSLSIYSTHKRGRPGALPFAIGSLLSGLWVAGSVLRYAAVDTSSKMFWYSFENIWQLPAATAITCFILEYAWPRRWLTHRNIILLSLVPLLDILLILTHHLYPLEWRDITTSGSSLPQQGAANWFIFSYAYVLGILNIIVLGWLFWRSPQHRRPVVIMLTGQITARLLYLLGMLNILRSDLFLDTLGIGFLFLMYAIVLFGFHLFDPVPLARQAAVEQIRAGMLVLDPGGRITNLNPAAEKILGAPASHLKNRLVKELLPAYPDGSGSVPEETETEFSSGTGQDTRHYAMSISALKDFRGLEMGRLVLLRDVTERRQAQAKLVEQQRALALLRERERLARELHDSLGQVFAFVNTQGQTIRRLLNRGDISTAQKYVDRLVDVARDADMDIRESILGLRTTLYEQGFFPALFQYLARYEKNCNIHAELMKPEALGEGTFEPLMEVQLLRIIQEALTNVRKHANADSVRIAFTLKGRCIWVTIQDDGQGFDSGTRLGKIDEHVGLRVMQERAEEVGGSIRVQSESGQGTVVEVCMPVKEEAGTG